MNMKNTAITLVALGLLCGCIQRPQMTKDRAKSIFTRETGITITNDADIIGFKDDHRGFVGDGEFGIGVCVSKSTMKALLDATPPLGQEWRRGPVEGEIGFHCAFIYSSSPGYGGIQGEERYDGGSPEAVEILSSTNAFYCAKARGPDSMLWHNGTLLLVMPSDSTVWLSMWDW